ncbi:MAG TPA: SPFH domain-containing protein [Anaerohalosphaeraceae bacterium]|nr:SPFH domain-containing protein [Anaerohalosphaeraceae bacterium]
MAEHHHHLHDKAKMPQRELPSEPLDASTKSLTQALHVSFSILKVIMIVLLAVFACSGIFQVQQDEEALLLFFGRIQGPAEDPVLKPGIKFAFPEPIHEVIRIPVKREQSLAVNSFWYFETEEEKLRPVKTPVFGPLDPLKDGYCLTRNDRVEGIEGADYNIVHSQWTITYKIDSPKHFFENVYIRDRRPGEDMLEAAAQTLEPMLESMASEAIVRTLVHYSIDEAIKSQTGIADSVKVILQDKLDQIQSGIGIKDVRANRIIWPRQVEEAFQASNKARQESEQARIDARAYKEKKLTDTGGPDAERILELLTQPGLSPQQQEEYVAKLSGQVQSKISEARAYRTRVVEDAKANAEYLRQLLPEYRKHPELVLQKIYQDAVEQVLAGADEKILIQPSVEGRSRELRVMINRDPNIKKEKAKQESSK